MLKYGRIQKRGGLIVKKSILFIILGLAIITGCSERNMQKEDSLVEDKSIQDAIEIPKESDKEDAIEVKEELGQPSDEDTPTVENTNSNENQQHSITITNDSNISTNTTEGKIDRDNPFTNAVAFDNMLYYDFISADHFETKHYLSLGDEIELIENEKVYAKVKLNNFKVIDDKNGTGRKALALFYTHTNVSNGDIESGPFGIAANPTFSSDVVVGNKNFKIMSHTTPDSKMYDENYIQNQHVQYTEEDAGMDSCMRVKTLKAGESRDCYAHYSFMGATEYMVGHMSEINFNEWRTYLINVTQEDVTKK